MAKVLNYVPEVRTKFFCPKGGLHAEEILNVVCLDPLCRNNPLGCPICFSEVHKYHRVISVDQFIDDYSRNVKRLNENKTLSKIENHHRVVSDLIDRLREDVNKKLDEFAENIDEYADELRNKTNLREYISKKLGVPLEPNTVRNSKNHQQFVQFLKFTLNNSRFDKSNSMSSIADILKHDQQRIYVLLDKMVNMTEMCQEYIEDAMKSLNFAEDTIKTEKITLRDNMNKMKINKDSFNSKQFVIKEQLHKTMANTMELKKQHWRKQLVANSQDLQSEIKQLPKELKFKFDSINKHEMIQIKDKSTIGVSNITALKPQYALLTPHLTTDPNQVKQWIIKINNCRNFASENTLAVGVATLQDLKKAKYEGSFPKEAVMLTSQGYVLQKGINRKTNVIFGAGDTLYCSYDPFYGLLEIGKQNGRKITLKAEKPQNQELYICVRLTYASDQVQII